MDWCCVREVTAWRGASCTIRRGYFQRGQNTALVTFLYASHRGGGEGTTGKHTSTATPLFVFHGVSYSSSAFQYLLHTSIARFLRLLQRGTTAQRRNMELLLFRRVDRFLVRFMPAGSYATEPCSTHENEHALHCHNQC